MYAKDFGWDVIVVSIHCGSKKRPPLGVHETNTATLGLATDFGEALYAKYNSPALPAAVFDRTTNPIEDMKTWMTPIGEAFKRSTSLSLTLNAVYSPADSTINVTLSGQSSLDLQGNVHVWLTEDDIVAMQMLKPEDRPAFGGQTYNYEHQFNHIFRAAITPMEGEPINFAWNDAEPVSKSYSIAVDSKWNVNNMTVVAFVDNATGVCQATKAPVVAEANK